jgi:anaerobic glycerol-3-phosphate dehydrogenase
MTNNLPLLSVLAVGTVKSVGLSKNSIIVVQQSFKLYYFLILIVGMYGYLSFIHRIENPTCLPTPIGTKEVCMQFKLPSDELHHEQ